MIKQNTAIKDLFKRVSVSCARLNTECEEAYLTCGDYTKALTPERVFAVNELVKQLLAELEATEVTSKMSKQITSEDPLTQKLYVLSGVSSWYGVSSMDIRRTAIAVGFAEWSKNKRRKTLFPQYRSYMPASDEKTLAYRCLDYMEWQRDWLSGFLQKQSQNEKKRKTRGWLYQYYGLSDPEGNSNTKNEMFLVNKISNCFDRDELSDEEFDKFYAFARYRIDIWTDILEVLCSSELGEGDIEDKIRFQVIRIRKLMTAYNDRGWMTPEQCERIRKLKLHLKVSKLQRDVESVLVDMGIPFECEKTFEDCRDVGLLRFDLAVEIDGQLMLIEVDGDQHFKPVWKFGGKKAFDERKKHDAIKNDYCKSHNIPLLRISTRDRKEIKYILQAFFSTKGQVAVS